MVYILSVMWYNVYTNNAEKRFFMNHTSSVQLSVPFWSMDVQGVFFDVMKNERGFAMSADHAHQHFELTFGFSRVPVRHSVAGKSMDTETPYILFRAPYVLHSLHTLSDAPYKRCQVYFHPGILKKYESVCDLGRLRGIRACTIPVDEAQMEYLERLLSHGRRLWKEGAPEKTCAGLLAALLHEVSDLVPEDQFGVVPVEGYLQEMMYYIVEHTEADLSMEALSRQFFVGKTKLAEDFRAVTGQKIHEYVTAIRLYRVRTLLKEGVPMEVIAAQCGFSCVSAMIRVFRREMGMTPGEWRKKNK